MSKIIQIQDINSSDTLKTMVEKINYNFDQIMAFGGGPKGEMGLRGFIGPDGEQGEQGERGNLITVVDNISTVGDNLKVGDLAIYSNDQYIYKVEEIDGEKHFVNTNICIKGNAGESGTSDSPFGYSGDAIVTNKKGTSVPKYTFIGTDKTIEGNIIGGNIGNLNVVGRDGIHIFTYTDDTGSDKGYCGKIYGGELDNENNILVLRGEDKDDNYVKIDNTLLADKIHSSDNGIKIAEIINDGVVLGDGSKNTSIEGNKFNVTSPNIILRGNLFVNNDDYNYTTKICGNSININSSNVIIGNNLDSQSNTQINGNAVVSGNAVVLTDALVFKNVNVIKNATIFGNATISKEATAKVNGVSDVYLGCPIGSIIMWFGTNVPDKWHICDGEEIWNQDAKPSADSLPYASPTALYGDEYKKLYKLYNELPDCWYCTCNIDGEDEIYYWEKDRSWTKDRSNIGYSTTELIVEDIKCINTSVSCRNFKKTKVKRLPNLQQRFPLGAKDGTIKTGYNSAGEQNTQSTNLGSTGGNSQVTLSVQTMPKHNHSISNIRENTQRAQLVTGSAALYTSFAGGVAPIIESTGGNKAHNNIPPFFAINFIIKYE